MGPIALFDKSFLQSLSLDESVWFDRFFLANISPLFYVETLADLEKQIKNGQTAEQAVAGIAEKAPQMSGAPNISHIELLLANLMGQPISMTNRPIIGGGQLVESDGKRGVNFDIFPEAKAFARWREGEYKKVEREFARSWRSQIKAMTFEKSGLYAQKLGVDISSCKNMDDAVTAAEMMLRNNTKPYDLIEFIFTCVDIAPEHQQMILQRYQTSGFPPLVHYAPYAAHVIKTEVFFHICVSRGFISADRPSNKIDVAYLHYLPFCHVFVSGDKLHRSTARLFIKPNQRFVWGPDLKKDLARLNEHYMGLPQEVKERGIISFAINPPTEGDYLTSELWDLRGKSWRRRTENLLPLDDETEAEVVSNLQRYTHDSKPLSGRMLDASEELDSMILQRSIKRKRGSWYQVPKNLNR